MADSGIRVRHLWFPNRGDAHTFLIFKVLKALKQSLRVIGNIKKRKKTQTTELTIFLSKIFFRCRIRIEIFTFEKKTSKQKITHFCNGKMLPKSERIIVSSHKRLDYKFFFYQWKGFSFKKTVYELYRVTNSQKFSEFMRRYRKPHLG